MLPPVSSTSWMMMARVTAPASATWHLATVHPRSVSWQTLWDTHRRKQSPLGLTPLWTLTQRPLSSHLSTGRNYDNGGCISHRLHHHARRISLRPVRVDRRAVLGATPIGSSTTPWIGGTIPHTSLGQTRTSLPRQCFCAACPSRTTLMNRRSTRTSRH